MYYNLILTGMLLMNVVNTVNGEKAGRKRPVQALLTGKEWQVCSYGFDKNSDGLIDESEEMIPDCQKDNTYLFHANGIGSFFDKSIQCGTGDTENNFVWKLTDDDSTLDLQTYSASVVLIDEHQLVLSPAKPANVPLGNFLIVFRH